ncbi:MAG: FixJ family two-component response regulator [Glaciecola sp.]|jgi:FixJ family two-component response regulator
MKNAQVKEFNATVHVFDDAVLDSVSLLLSSIGINNFTYNNAQDFWMLTVNTTSTNTLAEF